VRNPAGQEVVVFGVVVSSYFKVSGSGVSNLDGGVEVGVGGVSVERCFVFVWAAHAPVWHQGLTRYFRLRPTRRLTAASNS
jgi:hypothetical protein